MQESDGHPLGALARGLVDQADALGLGVGELLLDVLASEGHVVAADAAVLDELGDGRLLGGRLQQLDLGLAQQEESRAHLLVGDLLDGVTLQTQHALPVGNGFIQALHSDAEMLDMRNFHNAIKFDLNIFDCGMFCASFCAHKDSRIFGNCQFLNRIFCIYFQSLFRMECSDRRNPDAAGETARTRRSRGVGPAS